MGKRAPQSPSPRVRSKRVQSVDIMSPLNLDTLEDLGNEKSRSKSRFAGSFYSNRRYIMHIRHITVSELCDAAKISCSTIYNTMGARCTPRPLVAGHGCLEKNSSYFPKIKKDLKRKVSSLFHGGDKRDRTADLLTASQALSQLSYTPEPEQLTV